MTPPAEPGWPKRPAQDGPIPEPGSGSESRSGSGPGSIEESGPGSIEESGPTSLGALLYYALLTLVMTWPLGIRAWQRLPQHASDLWIFLWNDWWLGRALASGSSLYHTPYLFYPTGVSLAFHSHSQLTSLCNMLLARLTGPIAAFNLTLLAGLVLSGWGMYLLARDLTGDRRAAFVSGIVFAFAPYHLTQALAHPNLATVQWYPFMALFLRRAMLRRSPRDGALAGLFFGLAVWSGLHLGHLGALFAIAFVALTWVSQPAARGRGALGALAVAGVVAAALALPALVPVARELRAMEGGLSAVSVEKWESFQTDPVAWVVPPRYHPVFGRWTAPLYERFDRNERWMPYLGFVALGLALLGAARAGRAACVWWGSGLIWMILALGTHLRFAGVLYPAIRLPFALIGDRFPFSTLRSADRFNILVPLCLAALVAYGVTQLRGRRAALFAGIAIAFEILCAPIPTNKPPDVSPFIRNMAQDRETYAIVDAPMSSDYSKRWMYLQTIHGKPIVEGHVSRVPPHAYDYIDRVPLLRALRHEEAPPPTDVPADLCTLARDRFRYIVLHAEYAGSERLARWQRWFPDAPIYQDKELVVYRTDPACEASPR